MRTRSGLPVLSGIVICAAGAAAVLFYAHRPAASQTLAAGGDSVISFRMRFGVKDTEPKPWDGSLTVSGGEALRIRDWRPRSGDRIDGNRGWSLSSRRGLNFGCRPWEEEAPGGVDTPETTKNQIG
jgi:hypothetical protein